MSVRLNFFKSDNVSNAIQPFQPPDLQKFTLQ